MTTLEAPKRQVGEMLRLWRERRHLSQLDLALLAEVSTRHLSFVETGRARPSSQMIVRLTEQLEVPLRERNQLLLAAGYAPLYSETGLDAPQMSSIRAAVRQVLTGHEPYPAVAFDQSWSMVDGNSAVQLFLDGVSPELLQPPVNILRVALHPDGMANSIINVGEWRAHLLGRLRRQIALTADPQLEQLFEELRRYPCDQPEPDPDLVEARRVVVPLRLRAHDYSELVFFSTVTAFGTPFDITVEELAIESFFPADEPTAAALRRLPSYARNL